MSSNELFNPYLAARAEWNERYGSYIKAASSWRFVALVSLSMAVISSGYALHQSTQVKLVPYLVEVDKLGNAVMGGFPAQIEYADERVVRSMLSGWVANFRSVTPDSAVQKSSIDRTYALLQRQDPSTEKINNWLRTHSPFERARDTTVSVEVSNVVAISNQSYQIDWSETERDRSGKERRTQRYRGIATLSLSPPQDEAVIRHNPIGLYIKDFDWTAQLS